MLKPYVKIAISMETAGDILKSALRKLNDPEAAPAWLAANWIAIAGERVAAHALPVALQDGVFRIQVDSSAWRTQVTAMEKTICQRINRAWGGTLVRRVRVEEKPSILPRLSRAEDNRHTPFIRKKSANHHENQ